MHLIPKSIHKTLSEQINIISSKFCVVTEKLDFNVSFNMEMTPEANAFDILLKLNINT